MSTFILFTAIIEVSDIGDKWSPKKLPDAIAPKTKYGLIPHFNERGIKMGTAKDIVPVEVPQIVEIKQHITKNIATKKLLFNPNFINKLNNASDNPLFFIILDNTPAKTNINIHEIKVVSFDKLFMQSFPKFFLLGFIKNEIITEINAAIQNVFKLAFFVMTKTIILKDKNIKGIKFIKLLLVFFIFFSLQ